MSRFSGMVTFFSFLMGLLTGCADTFDVFGGSGGQGGNGASGGSSSTGGEGGAGGSNVGGEGGSGAQGGNGGNAGSTSMGGGGNGGDGGSGGSGGAGGGPTCADPPEPNAVTFDCTNACFKVMVWDAGTVIVAESSNNDGLCEPTQPFITHPSDGQSLLTWVYDPVNSNAFTATSLGDYPTNCYIKCGPDPVGDAPTHSEMVTQLGNGGYVQVSCGTAPGISLGQACQFGMYAVMNF